MLAVSAVLCFNALSIPSANADAFWTNAIEQPGLAALNHGSVFDGPIACPSSGNCVSGGAYADSASSDSAFLSQETNGVWSNATEVATALNTGGFAKVFALSCPTAGNCTAAGGYTDSSQTYHTFVVSQVNGTWGVATEVPDFANLTAGSASEMQSLTCFSATSCVGFGILGGATSKGLQPIVFTETNGVWSAPVEAPGTASFNSSGVAEVDVLDCLSATTCSAIGNDIESVASGFISVPFLISETNGVWGNVQGVLGIAALNGGSVYASGLSCGAPGDCTAVGSSFEDANLGSSLAFSVNESDGVWGSAAQITSGPGLGNGLGIELNDVECPSPTQCTAIGAYDDSKGLHPFVMNETNQVWSVATTFFGPSILGGGVDFSNLSCSAVGECSAAGTYIDATVHTQAFLVNETSGTWAKPIEAPGTALLNKGGEAAISDLSCSSDGSCGLQGTYTDGKMNTQIFVVNSSAVAPTTVSSAPRHVTAVDKKAVITVRWSAPASNGGTAITSYSVVSVPKSKTCVTKSTSCTFRGLNKRLHYSFEVRATNKDGVSALSAKSNAVRAG